MTDDASLYRRVTLGALVAAPATFLVDNILHPQELARGNEATQLAAVAEAYDRWQIAHLLALVSVVIFAAATAGLGWMLYRRAPKLAVWGAALGIAGLIGLGAVVAIDGFAWGILGEVSARPGVDADTVVLALHDMQTSEYGLPYYLLPLGWIVGLLVLAYGLARGRLVPAWAAALLGLGVFMVGIEAAVADNAYFIAAASVLLVGCWAVAWALARRPAQP